MSQRAKRVAGNVQQILAAALARGEIKDHRVGEAEIITITHVDVSPDLRNARVLFMVHGFSPDKNEEVRQGLNSAAGYLRRLVGKELQTKVIPSLKFHVDETFAKEERVDAIFREIESDKGKTPTK